MSDTSTIPAVLRSRNVDAIAWSEARAGDYVLLLDPFARADGQVFYITELVEDQPIENESVFYVNLVGDDNLVLDVNTDPAHRRYQRRSFSHSLWQVWRVFGRDAAHDDDTPTREIDAIMRCVDRLIDKHARANGLCVNGLRAFRTDVNHALGWEALTGTPQRVQVECRLHFTLEGVSEDDIDCDHIAQVVALGIRSRIENGGAIMVDGLNGVHFDWNTEEVTS